MKRPAPVILRGETRWFLSMLLAILLSAFAAANVFAAPFAYITNYYSGSVSVIDTSTNTVVATVNVGGWPVSAAVNPAGTRVYVSDRWSSIVSVIDTCNNTVIATVNDVGNQLIGVAVNPAGTRVYVTAYYGSKLAVIDTSTNAVVKKIDVGDVPHGVAVNPAGTRVYVANWVSSSVSVIDTSTDTVVTTVNVGGGPNGVAVNPAGTRVYVTNWYGWVSVIDANTNTVVGGVTVGSAPTGIAINPTGTRVYVANRYSSSVSVIDTSTDTVVKTIDNVGIEPTGVAVNPAGTRVYVTDFRSPTVFVIDTSTNTIVDTIGVGSGSYASYGIFIGPDLPPGLVSWWPGEGNADDVVGGNDGALQGGATFAPGMVGQAFSFDGVNDEVKVPYAANLNPTQALTLDAWVNINSLTNAANGGYQGVVSMSEGQRAYWFGITGTGSNHMGMAGNVHLEGFGIGSAHRTSAAVITPGQWYHIAGVIEPSTNRFEIYVNGVLQPAVSSGGGPQLASVSNVPFRIGFSDPGFPYHFNGLIDEVQIYNRALSAQEIQAIFNAGSAGMCTPADTTPPTTTATPSPGPNANEWNNTDVIVTLNATDEGGSGVKEIRYSLNGGSETVVSGSSALVTISTEGTTVLTYFAKDNAGNQEAQKTLTVKIDKTPPSIMGLHTPGPNANGWNNTDVTVSFTCLDNPSGIASCTSPTVLSTEGANQSVSGKAVDLAGNSASTTVSVNIDKTPPVVSVTRTPLANANGWNNTDVTVTASGTDALSGIDSCTSMTLTGEGAGQTASAGCTDKAGNSASATVSGINIDKTAPVTTATLSPTPNGEGWNNTNVSVSLAATDNLSGVARTEFSLDGAGWVTYTGAISISTEGIHTLLYRSLDRADNLESARSLTIRIDKTTPEMAARCAPPGGSPFLTGRDSSSGMASVLLTGSSAIRRGEFKRQETYTILDKAGNRLEASFGVKAEGHETEFTLLSLAYNGGAQLTLPENELKCEWAMEKTGVLKELEQKLEIGRAQSEVEVQAKFEGKKNETEIKVKTHGSEPHQRVTRPGVVFLNLTTNQGALRVDY